MQDQNYELEEDGSGIFFGDVGHAGERGMLNVEWSTLNVRSFVIQHSTLNIQHSSPPRPRNDNQDR
jgi:hypothetical protein